MSAIVKSDVEKARAELNAMRRSLGSWLKFRLRNDAVLRGAVPTKKPIGFARTVIMQSRDEESEKRLAKQLYVLLSESFPDLMLPSPDAPNAAVELAQIAVSGKGVSVKSPTQQGFLPLLFTWPVLIVGGVLLTVTYAIKSSADLAMERERYACIQAGACTDYGFWLKAGGIAALGMVAWQMGLGEKVKKLLK